MEDLIPIFVCVVLPVAVVWIIFRAQMNSDNKRTEVLIKAIETNNDIDADKLTEAFQKPRRNAREILNLRLLRGCICTLTGIAILIVCLYYYNAAPYKYKIDECTGFLMCGLVALAIGISYLIVYFVTRNQVEHQEKQ